MKNKRKNKSPILPDQGNELAASILKKQFRFSDWIAERVIKTVAFLSITIVVLIFVFVFRETLPIFHVRDHQQDITGIISDSSASSLMPQSYSPDEPESAADLKPGTYGSVPEDMSGDSTRDTTVASVSSGETGISVERENRKAITTFLSKDWQPVSDHPRYGLVPLFFGTLKVTLIAILFAAPIAILAALYTALFAPARIREYIKPAIELLAGFPSVVIGFFALMILASFFQNLFGYQGRLNAFV